MQSRQRAICRATLVLSAFCALSILTTQGHASDTTTGLTQEFHHTYSLNPQGKVSLDNINGPVHISSWDRNEVKVDAVKHADNQERLDEARIQIDADSNAISIQTKYPDHSDYGRGSNPAWVEYTLTVPRNVRLDEIKLINGSLDVSGTSGEVHASCINGTLSAKELTGPLKLSTINGLADVELGRSESDQVEISSVNGLVKLTLPSDAKAQIAANSVTGKISNEFGLRVNDHQYVGHDLSGELGGGGMRIHLSNVNGSIQIHRINDGHALGPVKDFTQRQKDDGEI
jgi:DUF4097 and DUF4098 domain-containing protein YvlB